MMMGFSFLPLPYPNQSLTYIQNILLLNTLTQHIMNKILGKIYGPLVVLVDVVLLIDIVSDLIQKRKARKAEKSIPEVIDEEETAEPEPVME